MKAVLSDTKETIEITTGTGLCAVAFDELIVEHKDIQYLFTESGKEWFTEILLVRLYPKIDKEVRNA